MCVETLPIEAIVVREGHPLRATEDDIISCQEVVCGDYEPLLISDDAVLFDGRTRLEALRRNRASHVRIRRLNLSDPAQVREEVAPLVFAKPVSRLNRLWRLLHASREYESAHPESRSVTVIGGPGCRGRQTTADSAIVCFADLVAGPGRSARTVRDHLQLARSLAPEVYTHLERSRDANNLQRLKQVAKYSQEEQVQIAKEVAPTGAELRDVLPAVKWHRDHGEPVRIDVPEFNVLCGDYVETSALIMDGSVDLILTDVPWQSSMHSRFPEMAQVFLSKLRPGGVAMVMSGQRWVPQLMATLLGAGFEYIWLSHYGHTRPQCPPHAGVAMSNWYPVLVFAKPGYPRTYNDPEDSFCELSATAQSSSPHRQRKSIEAFERMILAYSNQDDIVYDPFLGGGTTAHAAYRTRRRFIGSEITASHVQIVQQEVGCIEWGCDLDDKGRLKCDHYSEDEDIEDWRNVLVNE